MAVPRIKYEMFADIRYDGRLVDVLDRIRAIRLVLMVHIEQDLGPNKELVKIKILTPISVVVVSAYTILLPFQVDIMLPARALLALCAVYSKNAPS